MNVCVYGASSSTLEKIYYDAARELGRALAGKGWGLVFGGGRLGLMGAAAEGARDMGGTILGIAPKFFDEPGILFDDCTEFIFTETMRERKQLMEDNCDAVVVVPGGIGTYEEFFEMLTLKQLGRHSKAMVILNTNGYYDPMVALMKHTAEQNFMSRSCLELFHVVDTPAGALSYIESYKPKTGTLSRLADYNK